VDHSFAISEHLRSGDSLDQRIPKPKSTQKGGNVQPGRDDKVTAIDLLDRKDRPGLFLVRWIADDAGGPGPV